MYAVPRTEYSPGTLDDLLDLLDLTGVGGDRFRGVSPDPTAPRVFGGQVAAQSAVAAARTVGDERRLAALQGTFVRQGDASRPLEYDVARIGDGRRFTFRQVTAHQGGRPVFTATATFHAGGNGPEHQTPSAPEVDVASLPLFVPELSSLLSGAWEMRRSVEPLVVGGKVIQAMRTSAPMPDDQALHDALVIYASDEFILDTALFVHEPDTMRFHHYGIASIDHAVHLHRPVRMDEWFLYTLDSPIASHGRTLVRGEMRAATGELFASILQQGVIELPSTTNGHTP